ncbi:MAG: thiamine diphosphokinase [Chlamydiales bacterium]|nr:thiamine diphosphokinase [Chlamydiales bacterium]
MLNKLFIYSCLFVCSYLYPQDNYLIIANGPYEDEVVQSLVKDNIVIVLDGAANHLQDLIPNYILGDFDSISPIAEDKYKSLNVPFIYTENQDYTDLEKAIFFAKEKGAKTISICCALQGDRTDHSLGNLSILKRVYDSNIPIILHTKKEMIRFLHDESFSFDGAVGDKCAFFGWPFASVTTDGLVWDVTNWETEIGKQISSCNELKQSHVTIQVHGDILLIYAKEHFVN